MSQLSAKASVFKPINYIGEISKEVSSQGLDLFTATSYVKSKSVLLATAICFIRDSFGKMQEVRALLDGGSTSNFISQQCMNRLNLKREKINILVSGLNNSELTIKSRVNATIANRGNSYETNEDFFVVPRITDMIPSQPFNVSLGNFSREKLADENFNIPGNIDLLLGAEIFYEILLPGQTNLLNTKLIFQNTVFGYIASGSIPVSSENKPHCGLIKDNVDLEKTMRRFWEIENVEPETIKNKETIICSSVVMSDMYIDDVLTGAKTLLEAKELKNQLINIFAKGGAVVAKAKIFLQKLWMLKIDWTDLLPDTINREWRQFVESLQVVNDININRCIVVEQPEVIELHGFSDASQSAYGAVVYCKSITSDGKMLVHLIASKSRVAPTKQTTIPRLELCAAVLLAKLVHRVKQALKLNVTNTFLWIDSMIVLSWIRKESYQLKTFVANRIATIQEMTSSEQWRYVATEDNPADFVSRGMDSLKLKTCELWWNGPKFLMSNQYPQRQIPVAVIKDPGRSITSIVEPDLTNLNENRLDNWQKITKIIQLIWKRWSVDYLNSLQQRNKWHFEKKNAKIGDMVIIKEDNLPSCQWSLGRINNIYPGKDSKFQISKRSVSRCSFASTSPGYAVRNFVPINVDMRRDPLEVDLTDSGQQ
ncbi:uncharacterized protein TNCV_374191 [Trichonephila clavipes]|nr:uncharacterized protein TNCV_374191 [Trichonephila clavipes]